IKICRGGPRPLLIEKIYSATKFGLNRQPPPKSERRFVEFRRERPSGSVRPRLVNRWPKRSGKRLRSIVFASPITSADALTNDRRQTSVCNPTCADQKRSPSCLSSTGFPVASSRRNSWTRELPKAKSALKTVVCRKANPRPKLTPALLVSARVVESETAARRICPSLPPQSSEPSRP